VGTWDYFGKPCKHWVSTAHMSDFEVVWWRDGLIKRGIEMEIMQVHQMITECWQLYKEYYSKELTDSEFEQVYQKAVFW